MSESDKPDRGQFEDIEKWDRENRRAQPEPAAPESVSQQYLRELVHEKMQPLYDAFNQHPNTPDTIKTEADSFCDLHCADEHAPGCVLAADAEPVAWNPASKPLEFITECSDGTRFLNCAEMPAHAIRWSFAANPPRTALEPDPLEGTAHKEAVRRVGRADSVGGSMTDERKAFEAEISGPPYELDIDRWPNDQERYAWPGSYCDRGVDLAWCIWQARAALSAPAVPKGFKLVPIEPTQMMKLAGAFAQNYRTSEAVYRAMLAAVKDEK